MIPYTYHMVDMGGVDLAEANGTVVPGIYERITEAMNLCGDVILYNWKFAGIGIVPSAYAILQQTSSILINGMIQVTELDEITVIAIGPPVGPVEPLEVTENGVYEAEPPASGFNPVTVIVPERQPVIEPISITENGTYTAPTGKDGYSPVTVNVPSSAPVIESITITENGTYTAPTGKDGYSPVTVNVPQPTPITQSLTVTANGVYEPTSPAVGFNQVTVDVDDHVSPDDYAIKFNPPSNANSALSGGFAFRVVDFLNLEVSKLRVFPRYSTVSVFITDNSDNYIASVENVSVVSGQWNEVTLPSPVVLNGGERYRLWYSTASNPCRYYQGMPPINIRCIYDFSGCFSQSRYSIPKTVESNCYGVDFFVSKILFNTN